MVDANDRGKSSDPPTPSGGDTASAASADRTPEPTASLLNEASPSLCRQITMDIACVKCGYNIKGINSLDCCPECGFEIRRTLLFIVDPANSTIPPLRTPRQLGVALVLVALFLALAALILWLPSILYVGTLVSDRFEQWQVRSEDWRSSAIAIGLVVASGFLMIAFRRPTTEAPDPEYRKGLSSAATGMFTWAGFIAAISFYDNWYGLEWQERYTQMQADSIDIWRTLLRLGSIAALFLVVSGLHPVITFLGRRSVYHRIVQISRQGFRAMLVAVIITGVGDGIRFLLGVGEQLHFYLPYKDYIVLPSSMLSLIGSGMMTLALWNALVDGIRLSREMNRPRYTIDQVCAPRKRPT